MALFLDIKFGKKDMRVPMREVQKEMDTFGQAVSDRARVILESQGKNSTGNLSEAIEHEVLNDDKGNVKLSWPMTNAPYWLFVEKGVRGAINDAKAPDSPFKFGSGTGPKGGLGNAIRQWITDKPVKQWRDLKTGRFMSYDGMARMISRSVYLNGIAPTPFLLNTLVEYFKQYKRNLERAYATDIAASVNAWVRQNSKALFKIKF